MTKQKWKKVITTQTEAVGTYRKEFDSIIETLADILEQRDQTHKEFIESGGQAVTEFTSDRGAINLKKNPRLAVWMDLNAQALTYWRDLGLTPSGLKKLNDGALKADEQKRTFGDILSEIGI